MKNIHESIECILIENKAWREHHCLCVLFPELFRDIEEQDFICDRLDFLFIGFDSVRSIGGAGHYCVFHKLC